jgi:hypothetical protein
MPAGSGIGQGHRHLAQRDAADRAAVLAGRADAIDRGLLISSFIYDQHRIPVIEMTGRPRRRDVRHVPVVPGRAGQEALQPVRPRCPAASAIVQQL